MKAILKIIRRSTAIIKGLFAGSRFTARKEEEAVIIKWKAVNPLYKSLTIIKGNPDFPAWRSDVLLLHRRLAQYQRLRMHGSPYSEMALKKLEKQWRHVQRNSMRKIKGKTGKIIPISRPSSTLSHRS